MKKENITTTLRPQYKQILVNLSQDKGLSLGQTIEFLIDKAEEHKVFEVR
jgi:hypothetical protein